MDFDRVMIYNDIASRLNMLGFDEDYIKDAFQRRTIPQLLEFCDTCEELEHRYSEQEESKINEEMYLE